SKLFSLLVPLSGFPLIVLSWKRLGSLGTTIAVAFLAYTTILLLEMAQIKDVPPQYIGLIFDFTLGVLGATIVFSQYSIWIKIRSRFSWELIAGILILLIIGLCYFWGFDQVEQNLAFLDSLCAFATLSILIAGAKLEHNKLSQFIGSRFLVFIEIFSYSIYLIHAPILEMLWRYILCPLEWDKVSEFLALLVIGVPVILILSRVFFQFCEYTFLNRRSNSV
ncbi:acyltransferase, partial [Microcystis aeruginosa CS-556/03]|nr:acyltransferase [Microcystis aeruginosa CS-556/03]